MQIAVFIGPITAVLFSIFGFCIRYFDTPPMFRWMFHISYFRAGFHSLLYTVYGFDRMDLLCEEFYCHYKKPSKFLKEMEINDVNVVNNLILILGIGVLMHLLTASALWCKLNRRWTKYDPVKYSIYDIAYSLFEERHRMYSDMFFSWEKYKEIPWERFHRKFEKKIERSLRELAKSLFLP